MARLKCLCGEILSNVTQPNDIEGVLIKDWDLDFDDKKDNLEIMDLGRSVWECPICGRLAIASPKIGDSSVKWYYPEDGDYGHSNKKLT